VDIYNKTKGNQMKISILANDCVLKRGILAEHGLSIFIEYNNKSILFDTGQTDIFCRNAKSMNIDLTKTDAVILSHGHYDHCGGTEFLTDNKTVYANEELFIKRYALNPDKSLREIGLTKECKTKLDLCNVIFTQGVMQIFPDVYIFGESDVQKDCVSSGFYKQEKDNIVKDNFDDEQLLVIDTKKGLCVISGCSHKGIKSCLESVKKTFGKNIYMFMGGMHLNSACNDRITAVIKYFQAEKIKKVIPLHCTGICAISEIKKALNDSCMILYTGDTLELK